MINKTSGSNSQKPGDSGKKSSSATQKAASDTRDSVVRVMSGGSGNAVAGKVDRILSGKK